MSSVVAIEAGDPPLAGLACSGVAIDPSAIVTSASCVIDFLASEVLVYPNGVESGAASGLVVSDVRIDPWDPGVGGGSYRLAVLITASPHGVPAAARASAPPALDDAVTVVAFGESGATLDVYGETRREAPATVSSLQATPDPTIPSFEALPPTICDGDSGGGVFAEDGTLLGVINGGPNVCDGPSDAPVNIIDVSAHADFLDDAVLPVVDAGVGDAGTDAGADASVDAGSDGGTDAGSDSDAGSGADAGGSGPGPGMGDDGGCGCRAAPLSDGLAPWSAMGLALLGAFVLGRRRGSRSPPD